MAAMFKAQTDVWEETQEKMSQSVLTLVVCSCLPHNNIILSYYFAFDHNSQLRLELSLFTVARGAQFEGNLLLLVRPIINPTAPSRRAMSVIGAAKKVGTDLILESSALN